MSRRGSGIALALCVAVLLSVFVSSAFIAHEAAHPHDCCGEDCPICQFIAQVEQVLRGFGMILLAGLLMSFALAVDRNRPGLTGMDLPALGTLVSRKIRLND